MAPPQVVIISFEAEHVLTFEVLGKPVAFHRPGHGGPRQSYFNPKRYRDYVKAVRGHAVAAFLKTKLKKNEYPTGKARFAVMVVLDTTRNADVDNLTKPFLDGLAGVVYNDDRQVDKVWAERWAVGKDPVRHKARVMVYRMPSAATKRKTK